MNPSLHPFYQQKTVQGLPQPYPRQFDRDAVWLCASQLTGQVSLIHGGLAQVLKGYPQHFSLNLLGAPSGYTRHPRR